MTGVWYGIAAYSIWGLLTLYWRLFPHVPAVQVLGHRIVWAFVVLAAIIAASWPRRRTTMRLLTPRAIGLYAVAAALISINWFLFLWAVNNGLVVASSLGYFITPLVNVLLGVIVLRERLRAMQWLAVALAFAGVVRLALAYGGVPWIALALAASFGGYGLVKKTAPLPSLEGLAVETAVLFLPAATYLVLLDRQGTGAFLDNGVLTDVLLVMAGGITIVPLLLFASAVRRVPLSVIGVLQYISPTIQFLLGVLVIREPFTQSQLSGFVLVWMGLLVFGLDGVRTRRSAAVAPVLDEGAA
ncbi:MAG TPA: EamA family transporter RarD [Vicinamibacterales bacterium]|nr:EamA family transporter RarD [Vicinamibacterales bacterium]